VAFSTIDIATDDTSALVTAHNFNASTLSALFTSAATFSGGLTATSAVTLSSTLAVASDVVLSSTLSVVSSLHVGGSATLSGPLSALTSVGLSGTLTVTSTAAFSADVTCTSTVTASANLNVTASLCVSGALSVAGSAVISGDLQVGGNISFTDMQIQGVLSHTGSQIGFYDTATISQFSSIATITDNTNAQVLGTEVNSGISEGTKTTAFRSPGAGGTFYYQGFYNFATSDAAFAASIAFGTATRSYAAHFFMVMGDSAASDVAFTVSGTSIQDDQTRSAGDTEILSLSGASNGYFETSKKWLGQITIESAGAASAIPVNYGFAKYWDNNNSDFTVIGTEAVWLGGANDTGADLQLLHHQASGWTYSAGSPPTEPAAITGMVSTHVTEVNIGNNEQGAWKVCGLNVSIAGGGSEGILWKAVTTGVNTFEVGNFTMHFHAVNSQVDSALATLTHTLNAVTSALRVYGLLSA
jgi:hypothetical protein